MNDLSKWFGPKSVVWLCWVFELCYPQIIHESFMDFPRLLLPVPRAFISFRYIKNICRNQGGYRLFSLLITKCFVALNGLLKVFDFCRQKKRLLFPFHSPIYTRNLQLQKKRSMKSFPKFKCWYAIVIKIQIFKILIFKYWKITGWFGSFLTLR